MSNTSFKDLLQDYFANIPKVGDLVKGKVISIEKGEIRFDVNGVIVGVVRGRELFSESSQFTDVKIGDEIESTVVEAENENGEMELSLRVAGNKMVWDRMAHLRDTNEPIDGKVTQANKGGLMIKVDALMGFLPVSQLNPDHYPRVPGGDKSRIFEHLKQFIGKKLRVKVLDADMEKEKLILSEKELWEEEQKSVLDSYKIGDAVDGEVSALTPFGAFVKFGEGLEGLVHISEIVWQRIGHPKDILKIGDEVKAQIIDLNKSKIYLSLKRLVEDPWKQVKERYKAGTVVEGEVHKVEPFGLMIKLDNEIHGLAHISDLTEKRVADSKAFLSQFQVGDKRKFEIISIEPAEHRLGLKLEGVKTQTEETKEVKSDEKKEEKVEEKTEEKTEKKSEKKAVKKTTKKKEKIEEKEEESKE